MALSSTMKQMLAAFLTVTKRIVTEPQSIMTTDFLNVTTILGDRGDVAIKQPAALGVRNQVLEPNNSMRRARRPPIVAACFFLAGLALGLAARPDGAAAAEAAQVRIGIARTMSDVGYYVADAMGYFRDEGIDVILTPFNSAAQMMAPLGVGDLDVGGGTVSAGFYNSIARGIATRIVADQASIPP
jgi:hypothetical protein